MQPDESSIWAYVMNIQCLNITRFYITVHVRHRFEPKLDRSHLDILQFCNYELILCYLRTISVCKSLVSGYYCTMLPCCLYTIQTTVVFTFVM